MAVKTGEIRCEPLTARAFEPFGQVVSAMGGAGREANLGTAQRFDWAAELVNLRPAARANVAVFRSTAQLLPFTLKMLERHPFSTQLFAPMRASRYLVCVCPAGADGRPEVAGLRAFVGGQGTAINYRPGVWHHPILALDADADLLMLAYEDGGEGDCEALTLSVPLEIRE